MTIEYKTVFYTNYQDWNGLRLQSNKYSTKIQIFKKGDIVDNYYIDNLLINSAYLLNMKSNKTNDCDLFKIRVVTHKNNHYEVVIRVSEDAVEKVYYRSVKPYGEEIETDMQGVQTSSMP